MNAEDDSQKLIGQVREHATRHRASARLRASIVERVAAEEARGGRRAWPSASSWRRAWPRAWIGAAGFACGALVAAAALLIARPLLDGERGLEAELVGSHVRSLMAGHLTDVASSDQHTVKPWFQGRLDYSPPVEDLSAGEFPLVGARLDVLRGQPVAALVYRHRAHTINVFVWPTTAREGLQHGARQGFNVVHWQDGAMQYWLVSDLNAQELDAFAALLRSRGPPSR